MAQVKKGDERASGSRNQTKIFSWILILMIVLSLGFLGGWLGAESKLKSGNIYNPDARAGQQIVLNESQVISDVANNVGPSVVSINVISEGIDTNLFGQQRIITHQSAGTGFIISEEGIVVTNRHVVPKGSTRISVTLSDGTELTEVEVVGRTNENDGLDIAFLKIKDKKGKDLKSIKIGDSSRMRVGDRVIAIGNALGQFQNTVTTGIISGYGRSVEAADDTNVETLYNLFQTDAAINQGNSGGPLVNINGEVIGINTAVAGGTAENIGFALPINDTKGLINTVLETGKFQRPYIGIRYVSITDDYAYEFNLSVKRGAYITSPQNSSLPAILPDSPAAKADLREKDIIIKINDTNIDEKNSLVSVLGRFSVGDSVKLTILRTGQEITVNVTLESAPQN